MDMIGLAGEPVLKFILSVLFGATVGLERYIHGRPAGLRTYILVCVAFTSLAILSEKYFQAAGAALPGGYKPDPARLLAGGLTGIGFLGAGIIIRSGAAVHGLTTAAGIWAISVVGMAVGMGSYCLAALLYGVTIFSLMGLRHLERRLKRDVYKTLELSFPSPGCSLEHLETRIREKKLHIVSTEMLEDRVQQVSAYKMILHGRDETSFLALGREMASLEGVRLVRIFAQGNGSP